MDEYIKKEDIEQKIQDGLNNLVLGYDAIEVLGMIYEMPAADVSPVRHGRWERTADGAALCTACKRKMNPSQYGYAFCSLCGAIMDGERKESAI